jgi:cytochrome c-type biogenesis protein CcmH
MQQKTSASAANWPHVRLLAGRPGRDIEAGMLFWVTASLLTIGAILSVLVPIARRSPDREQPSSHDLEVYRDQLGEIDRDAARGLIGTTEAEEARAEISRRILKIAGENERVDGSGVSGFRAAKAVGFAAVLSVPLVSWGLYSALGSPDMPSQPLAARLAVDPAKQPVDQLIARAEAHLQQFPDDGRGWDVLAPVYVRIGRYDDSVTAYEHAIKLLGASAAREAGLGEAIAAAAGGQITEDAQAAFRRALVLEPQHPKSQFFLASALAQAGRLDDAAAAWNAMRNTLPAGSPWLAVIDQATAEANSQMAADAAPPPAGPDADEMAAASEMSPEDRNTMIETMVARLDERLKENPQDAEGWQRLVRSYQVLGKPDQARDALARGVAALGEKTEQAAQLQAFAVSLGLARAE